MARKTTTGVLYVHSRDCTNRETCANNCNPSAEPWQAWVFDAKYIDPKTGAKGKKIRQRFASHAAAKSWRIDATKQVKDRKLRATAPRSLQEEVDEWLAGAESGAILNKRSEPFKPAVVRNYRISLQKRVLPALGDRPLSKIDHADLLDLQEELQGAGCSGSTIRNTFVPLQSILRRARRKGVIAVNPAVDLELPTAGRRERAATPAQATELLATLEGREAALWATAFYAGLRRGELRALRVVDVDLDAATIAVERGWDDKDGAIAPKSRAGRRTVFVLDALKPYLEPLVAERPSDALVFGGGPDDPFDPRAVARKAERAWTALDKARAEAADEAGEKPPAPIERYGLHEARHSFSTWCDHAGISAERAERYMGHAGVGVGAHYRHLLPAQRGEDRARLDAYLEGVTTGKVVQLAAAG